jgi:lipoyl(octanoyl) transferase
VQGPAAVQVAALAPPTPPAPRVRHLGRVEYEPTWRAMQRFTEQRDTTTPDEIWFLEHPPVFTLGVNASRAHLLAPGDIPVVQVDRGGQVTYHGPGQLVVYPLVDLRRVALGIRDFVIALERAVIGLAGDYGIAAASRRARAPRRQLSRARAQRGPRPRALCPHQSLRLRGTPDDTAGGARRTFERRGVCARTRAPPAARTAPAAVTALSPRRS